MHQNISHVLYLSFKKGSALIICCNNEFKNSSGSEKTGVDTNELVFLSITMLLSIE